MHAKKALVGLVLLTLGTLLMVALLPSVNLLPAATGVALVALVTAGTLLVGTSDSTAV